MMSQPGKQTIEIHTSPNILGDDWNEYFRVALVTVKRLFYCLEIETKINTSSVKRSGEDENWNKFSKQ